MLKKRIAQNLKAARKKKGLSQIEFAEFLSLSYEGYQKIERGLRYPDESTILKIAKALRIDPAHLFRAIKKFNKT